MRGRMANKLSYSVVRPQLYPDISLTVCCQPCYLTSWNLIGDLDILPWNMATQGSDSYKLKGPEKWQERFSDFLLFYYPETGHKTFIPGGKEPPYLQRWGDQGENWKNELVKFPQLTVLSSYLLPITVSKCFSLSILPRIKTLRFNYFLESSFSYKGFMSCEIYFK